MTIAILLLLAALCIITILIYRAETIREYAYTSFLASTCSLVVIFIPPHFDSFLDYILLALIPVGFIASFIFFAASLGDNNQ